jgi:cell division protein FtsB
MHELNLASDREQLADARAASAEAQVVTLERDLEQARARIRDLERKVKILKDEIIRDQIVSMAPDMTYETDLEAWGAPREELAEELAEVLR